MPPFVHDDFLLETDAARDLYHRVARNLPIIDYHCHLSPEAMAADHRFRSVTEIWLEGDHYKWRAMRANGIDEVIYVADPETYELLHVNAAFERDWLAREAVRRGRLRPRASVWIAPPAGSGAV